MATTLGTMPRKPQRKIRNFMTIWVMLTLLVGVLTFAGIYLATGSIGTASDAIVESIGGDNSGNDANALAQQTTATTVPLIAPPAAGGEATQAPPPVDNAAAAQPAATATVVPTINAPLVTGTLPTDESEFILGAHILGDYNDRLWNNLKIAKMDWVKIQVRYNRGDNADDYGWQVQFINEQGFGVLFGVVGHSADLQAPGYYDEYAAYVARLAEIGANGIEVWNEPNLDREWTMGAISGADYAELLQTAYTAIKAKNPNTMVVSAGPAPTGSAGPGQTACSQHPNYCNDDVWYREVAAAGAAAYMDCIGAHYNEGVVPANATSGDPRNPYPTQYLASNTERAYKPFADLGTPLPVCYTELGYLTSEGYGPLPPGFEWAVDVSLQEQATWLGTAALLNAQSGKVRMMIIWNLDFTEYGSNRGDDPKAGYAIVRGDDRCPACDTLGSLRP